jgi:hypothetical protein
MHTQHQKTQLNMIDLAFIILMYFMFVLLYFVFMFLFPLIFIKVI